MFLPYLKSTRFGCQFHSLFDHEQQVPQIFLGCCQPFNVITHPDQKNWASLIISPNEAVLAGGVDFLNQILIRADKVWSVAFIPLNPVPPHLQTLFPIEFPRHNKPRQCTEVGVQSRTFLGCWELLIEDGTHFLCDGLDDGELAVGETILKLLHN